MLNMYKFQKGLFKKKLMDTFETHHSLIILPYFTIIYALPVIYIYCICMVEIECSGVLSAHLFPTSHSETLYCSLKLDSW